ncbi:MAG: heme ABC exporter ATP-binding protein CcmA [Candidatus Hydrothermales bacterium]
MSNRYVILKLENIKKSFGKNEVLKGINLELKEGEIVAITGQDGSGKTTLLKILAGLLNPDYGKITFLDKDLVKERHKLKDKIGYSSEIFSLYPDLKVKETLNFFSEIFEIKNKKIIDEVLSITELKVATEKLAKELSGGMQKKLSLASILISKPKLLLLDEPTRGIDPVSRQKLWILFHKLAAQGISIILTTPYVLETNRATRSFTLKDGFLVSDEKEIYIKKTEILKKEEKETVIYVENISKKFGDFYAVKKLSFDIKRGEIFGFLGPNGAGKTTTLKMLLGLIEPTEGKIKIMGEELKRENIRKIRKNIGYLSQKFSLYQDLTLYENLKLYAGLYEVKDDEKKIEELIKFFDLEKWRNQITSELPLGVKQKLSLATILLNLPPILFLDEPTSGMGAQARSDFFKILESLKERGHTLIITTHYMDEAELCDRVLLIDRGECKALDSPLNLKEKFIENYKIYEIKVKDVLSFEKFLEEEREIMYTRTKDGFKIFSKKLGKIEETLKKALSIGIEIDLIKESEPDLEEIFYAKVLEI